MLRAKAIFITIILVFSALGLEAQEFVSGLQSNKEVRTEYKKDLSRLKSKGITDTLELPFFDDFSVSKIFPGDSLWSDQYVYINNTYPHEQLSMGVATFDALDDRGLLYEHASQTIFVADHLSSDPINLDGDASDNFYLSFFYQPQGILDEPGPSDSLTLQFWSVSDDMWHSVWKKNGSALHPFKPVIIKIDDDRFTSKGFRFRFVNYASLSSASGDIAMAGNADQWHIDYVYLDRNRNDADTILHDVAFTSPLRSVLNNYEAIPWNQFREWYVSLLGPPLSLHYNNNDNIVRNISRSFKIRDIYENTTVHTFPPLAKNIQPATREQYDAPLSYVFNTTNTDSALFEIKASLITDVFDTKNNDTIVYYQEFKNYFAVDDGSSEGGYGINGQGASNSMAVYRYKSFSPDTIRAINICFNDSYLNSNQRLFDLVVLSSFNQVPGDILYTQEEEMVDPGESINGFITYHLNDPVPVEGEFFVGWRQRSETWLNAGLDLNTPHMGRQYLYFGGTWSQSLVEGSLMIRPIVGKPLVSTGIGEMQYEYSAVNIWPNPASGIINIDIDAADLNKSSIEIYDIQGRKVMEAFGTQRINISDLREGMYFLILFRDDTSRSQGKFIKTR
ncbi:MAG: T9SS type A sorting domain-containing protein [Bacteroidales bacterium]|nr:T9SS type A sorting domain-containing protein [Bacteroidales bacterium]